MFEVIKQVLTSWQVIVVTLVILLYINLVSYVSRRYHRPRTFKKIKIDIFKKKPPKTAAAASNQDDMLSGSDDDDDGLGLEEA
jgi:hypothetical protein